MAAAIEECWPDGVIEEFDTDESYFHDIHARLERDLGKIPGASLRWQTEEKHESDTWRDDDDDEDDWPNVNEVPQWRSYHIFFLSPQGSEFEFETETESYEEIPEDEDEEDEIAPVTYPGTGWRGCSAIVSLASPFAAIRFVEYSEFKDGSKSAPDPYDVCYLDEETGESIILSDQYRKILSAEAYATLEKLRARIAAVLEKHRIRVLDDAVLDLPAPGLKGDKDIFPSGQPKVWDAFFFRGLE